MPHGPGAVGHASCAVARAPSHTCESPCAQAVECAKHELPPEVSHSTTYVHFAPGDRSPGLHFGILPWVGPRHRASPAYRPTWKCLMPVGNTAAQYSTDRGVASHTDRYHSQTPGPAVPVFDVRGLSVFYGDNKAVRDVNLKVGPRRITAMIGPSGCGKSTVLRTLNRMNDLIAGARV